MYPSLETAFPADTQALNFVQFQQLLARAGLRLPVIVQGSDEWIEQQLPPLVNVWPNAETLWCGGPAPSGAWQLPRGKANHELGREAACVVFDLRVELDLNSLAAVTGSITRGGALILLLPPLAASRDPFRRRLTWLAERCSELLWLQQGAAAAQPWELPRVLPVWPETHPEQAQAQAAIEGWLWDGVAAAGPLLLEADRGRGKSTAAGQAVAQWLQAQGQGRRVVVTAPRRDNAAILLSCCRDDRVRFAAADALLRENEMADVLIIEEAAALAPNLLRRLLRRAERTMLITTVNGYEGTGRGFVHRFKPYLDAQFTHFPRLSITDPVRWVAGDWLERWLNDCLLMAPTGHDCAWPEGAPGQVDAVSNWEFEEFRYEASPDHEYRLQGLAAVLTSAHYRTRPSDLLGLLQSNNLRTFACWYGSVPIAVALVAEEGELEPSLIPDIIAGRRRPPYQRLPQSLAVHCHCPDALQQCHWRIVRIAVQPALQRQRLGTALLASLVRLAQAEQVDVIGSLFAGDAGLAAFWRMNGCVPLRVGYTREASTGGHALLVGRGISARGQALVAMAATDFIDRLQLDLLTHMQHLPASLVWALIAGYADHGVKLPDSLRLHAGDTDKALRFANGHIAYEHVAVHVRRVVWAVLLLGEAGDIRPEHVHLLIQRCIQGQDWTALVDLFELSGRQQAIHEVRGAVAALLTGRSV